MVQKIKTKIIMVSIKKLAYLLTILLGTTAVFSSCEKSSDSVLISLDESPDHKIDYLYSADYAESQVSPKFGIPGQTNYLFKVVYQNLSLEPLWVKLYNKTTGNTTYHRMLLSGAMEYRAYLEISENGVYDYRYMIGFESNRRNLSNNSYRLWNSYNVFRNNGNSNLTWPFGADGSSYYNRLGWISSVEIGGCGSKHNENGHIYHSPLADDRYAEDWNKNCGTNDDNGAEFRSPLDGKVIKVRIDSPSNHHGGYGNSVDIEQETPNGTFVFRIAHLKYAPSVSVNQWVQAGKTKLGNIGMTGGTSTSFHAHIVLYKKNSSSSYTGKVFSFAPMSFYNLNE